MWQIWLVLSNHIFHREGRRVWYLPKGFLLCSGWYSGFQQRVYTSSPPLHISLKETLDKFSIFFQTKITNIRLNLDGELDEASHDNPPVLLVNDPTPGGTLKAFRGMTPEEIQKIISKSPTKTSGLYPFPTWLPKKLTAPLMPTITEVSIGTSWIHRRHVPHLWHCPKVWHQHTQLCWWYPTLLGIWSIDKQQYAIANIIIIIIIYSFSATAITKNDLSTEQVSQKQKTLWNS